MADKILKSITFPNLPDKYIIPETTVDSVPTQGSTNAVSSGGVYDVLHDIDDKIDGIKSDLNGQLDHVRERTYNLLDSNSAKWKASNNKQVTVTNPDADTIRVNSDASQTYAGAYCIVDVTGINTIYTSINDISGTGVNRSRIFTVSNNHPDSNLGPITKNGKTWDVSPYEQIAVVLEATTGTAGIGYIDYNKILVANSATEVPYKNFYEYEPVGNDAIVEVTNAQNKIDTILHSVPVSSYYVIAHRGDRQNAPENTMPAFISARERGYAYIETDIRYTSDGVAVLLHDSSINRTARNADGTAIAETVNIADITYNQALEYDFGIYKGEKYAGTKITTLAEFLRWCKITGCIPVLEQKVREVIAVNNTVNALQDAGITKNFYVLSYGLASLNIVHTSLPDGGFLYLRTSPLTQQDIDDASDYPFLTAIDADYSKTTAEMIAACKAANIPLYLYGYTSFDDVYNTDDYVSGYTVEVGLI